MEECSKQAKIEVLRESEGLHRTSIRGYLVALPKWQKDFRSSVILAHVRDVTVGQFATSCQSSRGKQEVIKSFPPTHDVGVVGFRQIRKWS